MTAAVLLVDWHVIAQTLVSVPVGAHSSGAVIQPLHCVRVAARLHPPKHAADRRVSAAIDGVCIVELGLAARKGGLID